MNRIELILGILALLSLVSMVSIASATTVELIPQGTEPYSISTQGLLEKPSIQNGSRIELKVKVIVDSKSPPLKGYTIYLQFKKPKSGLTNKVNFPFTEDTILPGQSRTITLSGKNEFFRADETGTWWAYVWLYDKYGTKVADDAAGFDVFDQLPPSIPTKYLLIAVAAFVIGVILAKD